MRPGDGLRAVLECRLLAIAQADQSESSAKAVLSAARLAEKMGWMPTVVRPSDWHLVTAIELQRSKEDRAAAKEWAQIDDLIRVCEAARSPSDCPWKVQSCELFVLRGKHQRQQHAAACRSARSWELLVGVLKHAAACRSMPQRAKIFTWRTFFFITCQTCEPFVAQRSQNWMVAQWSMYQVAVCRVPGSIPGVGNFLPVSFSLLLHRPSLFGVVLTCQVLRILKLPRF